MQDSFCWNYGPLILSYYETLKMEGITQIFKGLICTLTATGAVLRLNSGGGGAFRLQTSLIY